MLSNSSLFVCIAYVRKACFFERIIMYFRSPMDNAFTKNLFATILKVYIYGLTANTRAPSFHAVKFVTVCLHCM